jgi:signal transduction histidine kinase
MRNQLDLSLARFLMILSLVLLGILEYLWLHNEYKNKYRDMEDKLNHVMFSTIRDVEDSLIFSKMLVFNGKEEPDTGHRRMFNIVIHTEDSIKTIDDCGAVKGIEKERVKFRTRHPMRGMLLRELSGDTSGMDTPLINISAMVMSHLRTADSTGEYERYKIISWQGGDTVIREAMSRPQLDVMAGKKIALSNPHYKADIFHDLLPHLSFAVFLWLMVGAAFYYIWKNLRKQIHLNALRDEFVSNITHELKTPITTVGVALESLSMTAEPTNMQNRKYLDICQIELKRLSMMVERILHNRAPQVHYEELDVRQVLNDVMHNMKIQFDSKHAVVDIQQEGDGFVIHGDKSHMSGVLYNLFDNALKYSSEHPVIRVNLSKNKGVIRIDIKDNGIGIDPAYHDKIFEKLYRVPNQNRHDAKGHGLGLSYVADVVKKHRGKIDLVSQPGKGSTFTMIIPAIDPASTSLSNHTSTPLSNRVSTPLSNRASTPLSNHASTLVSDSDTTSPNNQSQIRG